jgi:hypothetical protein
MRSASGLALLTFTLIIGIASVDMLLAYSLHTEGVDPCYGYAIC